MFSSITLTCSIWAIARLLKWDSSCSLSLQWFGCLTDLYFFSNFPTSQSYNFNKKHSHFFKNSNQMNSVQGKQRELALTFTDDSIDFCLIFISLILPLPFSVGIDLRFRSLQLMLKTNSDVGTHLPIKKLHLEEVLIRFLRDSQKIQKKYFALRP